MSGFYFCFWVEEEVEVRVRVRGKGCERVSLCMMKGGGKRKVSKAYK